MATYVRSGCTASADPRPLGCEEFDEEGRALLTDHGEFVVLNLYAPCGNAKGRKFRFHRAVKALCDRKKREGKRVIVLGDLNVARGVGEVSRSTVSGFACACAYACRDEDEDEHTIT